MFPSFELLGKTIAMYPIMALMGVFAAGVYACKTAKIRGYDDNDMIVFMLIGAIGVLLGSHILYGFTHVDLMLSLVRNIGSYNSLGTFFEAAVTVFGGSVFYGGLTGGVIAAVIYAKKKKLDLEAYSDMSAPAISLLHAFGRIGCFLGGCCYGVKSDIGFIYTRALLPEANGISRFPIQLVESAFNVLLFYSLHRLLKAGYFKGKLFGVYLMSYAIGRFILEFWRGDDIRGFIFGLSTSQFISILALIVGLLYCCNTHSRLKPTQ